jgi:catechol 2,3-dioxygenase
MSDAGWPIEWGVGRHGPGNNVFSYFVGPDDFVIEYTSDVLQVDNSYPVGGPSDWTWPPGRFDQWGVSKPPSERIKVAQKKIRFIEQ